MKSKCVIIGGGIGGLFTGAFLSRNGVQVTVLEKNAIVGGGLQCFTRGGKTFETGMHVAGGFMPGGNLTRICKYLGIFDKLELQYIPSECMDEIYYHTSGATFKIASGKQAFIERLGSYFPHERAGIEAYVEELYRLTGEVPLFSLQSEAGMETQRHSQNFLVSADKLIESFVQDDKLREILAYLNPLYSGVRGHTPAYIHAILNVLYINGAVRFKGGGQQLADALCGVIEDGGGSVIANSPVVKIAVADKKVQYVETADGNRYKGDWYVSSIHPVAMAQMMPPGAFRRGFVKRLDEIPNTASAFSVYIDLKPSSFPYIDHTCYYMEDFGSMWEQDKQPVTDWPRSFMYMTPPDGCQGEYASRLLVHCLMEFDTVKKWANTKTGHRGADYEEWKKIMTDKIIDKLCNLFPDLRSKIAHVYSSSPLTIRDFYGTKDGAIFGYRKDCQNMIISRLPVYTKIDNLYLTGQNIILHGICGVPLTAINTAEAILGRDVIIYAINNDKAHE